MTGATGYELQKRSSCGFWFSAGLDGVCPNCEYLEALLWSVNIYIYIYSFFILFFNKSTS